MPEQIKESYGHVTVNEHVPTEKFSRFVDEQVKKWMGGHQGQDGVASEYEVAFFDEETLGEVSCLVVVHCGGQLWRAWQSGDNPREALARSLDHLSIDDETASSEAVASQTLIH